MGEGVQGELCGGVAGGAAGQHPGDLGQPGLLHDSFGVGDEAGVHHDDDLVDGFGPFEDVEGVLEDALPRDFQQLFGCGQADALTAASGQDDRDGPGRESGVRARRGCRGQSRLPSCVESCRPLLEVFTQERRAPGCARNEISSLRIWFAEGQGQAAPGGREVFPWASGRRPTFCVGLPLF